MLEKGHLAICKGKENLKFMNFWYNSPILRRQRVLTILPGSDGLSDNLSHKGPYGLYSGTCYSNLSNERDN